MAAIVAAGVGWSVLALWFDGPTPRAAAGTLAIATALGSLLLAASIRPLRRGLIAALVPVVAVGLWWSTIAAKNDRDWAPDVAQTAHASFDGNRVTIQNIRNFKYRSEDDYDQSWETRSFDLDRVKGIDLFLSFWGPTMIAHTIVSWEFDDGRHLAISIETRKQKGEAYSALRGFFRQYELYYVVADERDLVGLRTNYRREQVFLYRLHVPAADARALLVDYLERVNSLAQRPQWYNALTANCTTTIRSHTRSVGISQRPDWRMLVNGRLDELLYERGEIDTTLPFADLRARSDITKRAIAADNSPDFSSRIRQGLPAGSSRSIDRVNLGWLFGILWHALWPVEASGESGDVRGGI
jgi:hypothetical protein